jgi:hypothetical protein
MTAELILLLAGSCAGFWCGTRWPEVRRARHDMDLPTCLVTVEVTRLGFADRSRERP